MILMQFTLMIIFIHTENIMVEKTSLTIKPGIYINNPEVIFLEQIGDEEM